MTLLLFVLECDLQELELSRCGNIILSNPNCGGKSRNGLGMELSIRGFKSNSGVWVAEVIEATEAIEGSLLLILLMDAGDFKGVGGFRVFAGGGGSDGRWGWRWAWRGLMAPALVNESVLFARLLVMVMIFGRVLFRT